MNQKGAGDKILCAVFFVPVLWFALLLAQSCDGEGIISIIRNLTAALRQPFKIYWTEKSLIVLLVTSVAYWLGVSIWVEEQKHRRDGAEHGSATWGSPHQVNRMFAQKENILLTKNVKLGLD